MRHRGWLVGAECYGLAWLVVAGEARRGSQCHGLTGLDETRQARKGAARLGRA